MTPLPPEFQVNFKGVSFLTVRQGQLDVSGTDLQSDLANIARLIGILSDVMNAALTAKVEKPAPVPVFQEGNVYPISMGRRPTQTQIVKAG